MIALEPTEIAPTRVRRHPTSENPSRSSVDMNALVTIQETSTLLVALYVYLLGVEVIERIERFTLDSLSFTLCVSRAQREEVQTMLTSDGALVLRVYVERVREIEALVAVAQQSGVWSKGKS
jgi:hypothetical protein